MEKPQWLLDVTTLLSIVSSIKNCNINHPISKTRESSNPVFGFFLIKLKILLLNVRLILLHTLINVIGEWMMGFPGLCGISINLQVRLKLSILTFFKGILSN